MKKIILAILFLTASAIIASPFAKPSQASGIVKMNVLHASENIFPVSLFEINGKQIINRDNAVWLKPGNHTIRVRATVDLGLRSKMLTQRQKFNNPKSNNTLDIKIEDGKTYYVGYDTNDRDPNKWHPVVWKVK